MSHELSIARRLYGERNSGRRVSRPAISIAVGGVAVGLAVMIISVCVVLGFKEEIRSKVIGLGGHVELINYKTLYSAESHPIVIDSITMQRLAQIRGVDHVQRFCLKAGMLKTNAAFQGIMLRGVSAEYDTTFLAAHLTEGILPKFSDVKSSSRIVISRTQANQLNLGVGSKVYAYFFSETIKARRFEVCGIYETHLVEFDRNWVFTDFHTCRQLNGWETDQASGAELLLSGKKGGGLTATALFSSSVPAEHMDDVALQVSKFFNGQTDEYGQTYIAPTIRELYPSIFAWLSLLDTNVWVIMILMVAISLFTMTSGLLIIILERIRFIAVMKSLGSTNISLRKVFLYFASMLIGRGLFWGNIAGIGFCLLQQQFHLIHLDASTYYVEFVPILFSWPLIVIINILTFLIAVLVMVVPTYLVARIKPARVMRAE